MDRKLPVPATWLLVAVVIGGCGRSEQVGWSDRNPPSEDSATVRGSAGEAPADSLPARGGPPLPDTARALMIEYQRVAAQLESVRARAMEDSAIQARWTELNADVQERMVADNPFIAQLLGRAEEIEARFAEVEEEGGEPLSPEERSRLGRQWQEIQQTLGQARSQVMQEPEFTGRLQEFQSALYERMRAIAPERTPTIDRLERLGDAIVSLLDSLAVAGHDTPQDATP